MNRDDATRQVALGKPGMLDEHANHVTEELPFLVNGTLEGQAREMVVAHLVTCARCRFERGLWEALLKAAEAGSVGWFPPPSSAQVSALWARAVSSLGPNVDPLDVSAQVPPPLVPFKQSGSLEGDDCGARPDFASMLRCIRLRRGWTQRELADRIGVIAAVVQEWETTMRSLPEDATFGVLLDCLVPEGGDRAPLIATRRAATALQGRGDLTPGHADELVDDPAWIAAFSSALAPSDGDEANGFSGLEEGAHIFDALLEASPGLDGAPSPAEALTLQLAELSVFAPGVGAGDDEDDADAADGLAPAGADADGLDLPELADLGPIDYDPAGISLDDPVRMYLREIGRVSLLSAAQEVHLAQAIERGDYLSPREMRATPGGARRRRSPVEVGLETYRSLMRGWPLVADLYAEKTGSRPGAAPPMCGGGHPDQQAPVRGRSRASTRRYELTEEELEHRLRAVLVEFNTLPPRVAASTRHAGDWPSDDEAEAALTALAPGSAPALGEVDRGRQGAQAKLTEANLRLVVSASPRSTSAAACRCST